MQQDSSAPMTQDCVWHWRNSDFMVSISYSILRLACRSSQASHCLNVPLTAMGHPPRESGNASSSRVVPTFESGNASSAPGPASRRMRTAHERRVRPIVQPPLSPISMPANLPQDSGSDLSSSPCVKRQRQPRQCLAPPFDPDSCGNHLKDGSRTVAPWGKTGRKKLSKLYWDNMCTEEPTIDCVLDFFHWRLDRNGVPMSNKLGKPKNQKKGWWRFPMLPIKSPGNSSGEQWNIAWHGTNFECLYSIVYHDEMLESNQKGHMKANLQGVYCHKAGTSGQAENYMVFKDVFSNGQWWGALLELNVNRAVGRTTGDQWVQPAESVIVQGLWVCGRTHEQMIDSSWFWISPWDPIKEVNPIKIFGEGVAPLRKKREMQARKTEQIGEALTSSLPFYGNPSTQILILEAEKESAAQQGRQHALAGISGAVPDVLDDDNIADNWDTDGGVGPDVDDRDSFRPCPDSDCWSPHYPMCPSCMEAMKQKKARALDGKARWRLPCADSDLSEETLKQMSEDATDVYGTEEYSQLCDLFQGIDSWRDGDKDPIKEYLQSMTDRAHHANALANAWIGRKLRSANAFLQRQLFKLIEELPPTSVDKHNITSQSSARDKWHVVAKLVTQYIGEVRILWPERATWTLCKVDDWEYLSDMWLVRQFRVQLEGEAQDFASSWLTHNAKKHIQAQVRDIASTKRIRPAALWPCWEKQTMRTVAPVTFPKDLWHPMEWRLDGAVTNIGELLLRLGNTQDSFAELNCMKLHLQSDVRLLVRITKRHVKNCWERSIPLRAAHLPFQIDVPCCPHVLICLLMPLR